MDTCGNVSPSVPMVFVEGDSYTIGSTIRAAFKTQILTALCNDTFYNTIMLSYYRTPKGAALYESMYANASSSFPQYVDELQGMADAIGITLEEMVLWNLSLIGNCCHQMKPLWVWLAQTSSSFNQCVRH